MTLDPANAPRRRLRTVYHVGTLDPQDKGVRGESYEGTGLSVSRDPEAWVQIAKLGGLPWWKAAVAELRFVDMHALRRKHEAAIAQWGIEHGWVEPAPVYALFTYDDELEAEQCMEFASYDQAVREVLWEEDTQSPEAVKQALEDLGARVEQRLGWRPTAALRQAMGHDPTRLDEASTTLWDDVAVLWAQAHGWDGAWWEETLDPDNYSAPRGVIFKESVSKVAFKHHFTPSQRQRPVMG